MARYGKAEEMAYKVLLNYSDGTLPVNPFQILSNIKNIKLKTYREFARELQEKAPELSVDEIIATFESSYGFLMKKGNKKYILCYNDLHPVLTIRWTIFHELGHYFLEHLKDSSTTAAFSCEGQIVDSDREKEANCFARHCSCPLPVFSFAANNVKCEVTNSFLFRDLFWVSHKSCCYTLEHYFKYQRHYNASRNWDLIKRFEASVEKEIKKVQELTGYAYK